MVSIELTFIDNLPHKRLFYVRFIDDIFMILTHGRQELEHFTTGANSTHPSIKFTIGIFFTSTPFLDVLVSVTAIGNKTSLYRISTVRPNYHMYCSFHLHHIKSSIVLSQLHRLKRICSDISTMNIN